MKKTAGDWQGLPVESFVEPENGNLDFHRKKEDIPVVCTSNAMPIFVGDL